MAVCGFPRVSEQHDVSPEHHFITTKRLKKIRSCKIRKVIWGLSVGKRSFIASEKKRYRILRQHVKRGWPNCDHLQSWSMELSKTWKNLARQLNHVIGRGHMYERDLESMNYIPYLRLAVIFKLVNYDDDQKFIDFFLLCSNIPCSHLLFLIFKKKTIKNQFSTLLKSHYKDI